MAISDYQYITYKNVDGVAVVNFLETVSMFDSDKVKGVSDELIDLVESKRYSKLLLNLSNAHFVSSAMLAHLVKLHRKLQEAKGKLTALLPAAGHRRCLQGEQLRQDLRDLSRRGGGAQEVLTRTRRTVVVQTPSGRPQTALARRGTARPRSFWLSSLSPS